MRRIRQFPSRFMALFRRNRLESEMEEEMRLHIDYLALKKTKEGLSPDEARYAAQRQFGSVDQFKEACRDRMGWRLLEETIRDVRIGARALRRNVVFTAVAVLTLAFCIGANTAIFSMFYALLLRPLPLPEASRIVEIFNTFQKVGVRKMVSNPVQYTDFKANTTCFDAMALWNTGASFVGELGSEERLQVARCTAEMFEILGARPLVGDFFTLANSRAGEDKVIVLSEDYWRSHFNSDPSVLGKTLRLGGERFRVIGVAPRMIGGFDARVQLIRPYAWGPESESPKLRYLLNTSLYARLKPRFSSEQAQSQVMALERRYYETADSMYKATLDAMGHVMSVELVQNERVRPIKASLYLLQGGVIFVLLIGCLNVASLLLTRANGRNGEVAVRVALGAGRWAIARQFIVEGLLLTLAGAVLGIALAWGAIQVINRFSARMLPDTLPFALDGKMLGFTIAVSVTVGVLIGILPVTNALRTDLVAFVNRSSRSLSSGRGVRALNNLLVTGQVAVALVLLAGAGLLIHSLANALRVNPGFDPQNVMTGRISIPRTYQDQDKATNFQRNLLQELREIPGISDATLASGTPVEGGFSFNALAIRNSILPRGSAQTSAYQMGVSPGYFQTLHIQLVEGRLFDEKDSEKAYIVDERFAQKYFPGHSALGAHITFDKPQGDGLDWPVIVGVVRNVSNNGIDDQINLPFSYYPLSASHPAELSVFVRSSRDSGDLVSSIREKLHGVNPEIVLYHTETFESVVSDSFVDRRAIMLLISGFAGLALFLSAIGIYGVLSYDVSQRTREIGIRSAIGASQNDIVYMVVRQGLMRTVIGIVPGVVCALLLSRYMTSMLFELEPTDPWAYVSVSLLILAVASIACYFPARHASKIDPTQALRTE
jgi:putative ABC transport system permease protein